MRASLGGDEAGIVATVRGGAAERLAGWLDRRSAWTLAVALGLLAWIGFRLGLDRPPMPMFDEVHYLPAARAALEGVGGVNQEHPIAAKALIALSIRLSGDDPAGWRMLSTIAGAATVMLVFGIAVRLFGSTRTAATAALLALLNFTVFVQARIAMLDTFMVAFLLGGLLLALGPPRWKALMGAGVCLGLAIGCKWAAAIPAVTIGLGLMLASWRREGSAGTLKTAVLVGGSALVAYALSFAPIIGVPGGLGSWGELPAFHLEMIELQTQSLALHRYQSPVWSWPLGVRPIWYLYERIGEATQGVLLIANPVVMWGGLVAIVVGLADGWRGRRWTIAAPSLFWAVAMLQWAVIPKKIGFFYYYYLPSILLALVIAGVVHRHPGRGWVPALSLSFAVAAFVHFHPILSSTPLADPRAFERWAWLDSWV